MIDLSVVILAAGGSSRVGVSKQMMKYKEKTLLSLACETALLLSPHVTVITGANHHIIEANVSSLGIDKLYNENWSSGIASSISLAFKHEFNSDRVLLMYCHQPLIPFAHYQTLSAKSVEQHEKIIATEFNNHYDLPAIIPHHLFYEFTTLKDDDSPDLIIRSHLSEVSSVTCEQAAQKIVTREDMALLSE